jgi:hypothetical protein
MEYLFRYYLVLEALANEEARERRTEEVKVNVIIVPVFD